MIRTLSFDFWNTLATPNPEFSRLRNEYLASCFKVPDKDAQDLYTGIKSLLDGNAEASGVQGGVDDAWSVLLNSFFEDAPLPPKATLTHTRRIQEHVEELFEEHPPIFPKDLETAMIKLNREGYILNIVSNTNFISGAQIKKHIDMFCFDFTLFSDLELMAKPNPKLFEKVKRITGCKGDEITHIGDNIVADYHGATNAGLNAILVKNPEHTVKIINNLF